MCRGRRCGTPKIADSHHRETSALGKLPGCLQKVKKKLIIKILECENSVQPGVRKKEEAALVGDRKQGANSGKCCKNSAEKVKKMPR